jgi:hypothetical protein
MASLSFLPRFFEAVGVLRFKTTNALRAQPAALRHKRALNALLGKAAATTSGFMRRNRRSSLNTRDTLELDIGRGFADAYDVPMIHPPAKKKVKHIHPLLKVAFFPQC